MTEQEHLKWKSFWEDQAAVADPHQAVRGDRIMTPAVQSFHDRELIKLIDPQPEDRILDAGCGAGDQIILLGSLVARITAIDFSPAMVARCQARIAKEPNITAETTIEVGDVTGLPYEDNSFDRAISIAVQQYLNPEESDLMLTELGRVVKPGGVVVFHVKDLWSPTGVMITFGRWLRALIKGRPPLEYQYRTHWWYKKEARRIGKIAGSYAYGTWTPFMPKSLMAKIARWETKYRFLQNRWPHGKEYFIKVRVN